MRLKCIKMAGFKSFVDATTVVLPSSLCAIVGPNGCGKSNIIDAVRWVMGESSAKQLRGESITDVIFNGSGSRKAVGQASVELVFDNSDGSLGGEYASWSEISIKRKVTRDSQSSYYLNGDKCRRRDITDIFLGTGLGPRSYAIIEQGMISTLIDARPEELRVYIEEAAGISKYKERRKDTESRIKRTKENLERLADIREELRNQLNRLERQARAAEKYTELKKDERQNKAKLLALKWRFMAKHVAEHLKVIAGHDLKIEKTVASRIECDGVLEKHRINYTELSDSLNLIQDRYYSAGSEVSRIEQAIQYMQDRAQKLKKDFEETEQSFIETERHLFLDREKRKALELELQEILPVLEETRTKEILSRSSLQRAEEEMKAWHISWDEFIQNSSGPSQQGEVQQSKINFLEQLLSGLTEKIDKITCEYQSLSDISLKKELNILGKKLAETEAELSLKKYNLEQISVKIDNFRINAQLLDARLDESRTSLQNMSGRKSSLEALDKSLLGDDKSQLWLERKNLEKNPRLAEKIEVESGWETAIEVVLGGYLQAVCVETIDSLDISMSSLAQGELILIERSSYDQDATISLDISKSLLGKIKSGSSNNYLPVMLHNIYAVDDLNSALALRGKLKTGQSVVTPDGLWLGQNWLRIARDQDSIKGTLKRKIELESLEKELVDCRVQTDKIEQQKHINEQQLWELESQRETDRNDLAVKQNKQAELRSKINANEIQMNHFTVRSKRMKDELKETNTQKKIEQKNLSDAHERLDLALDAIKNNVQQKERLLLQRDAKRIILDDIRRVSQADRDQAHDLAMREKSVSTKLQSILEGIERLENQTARLGEKRQQLRESFNQDQDPSVELKEGLAIQLELRLKAENELLGSRREVEELGYLMRDLEQQRNSLEADIQQERSLLEQQRLSSQDLETRSQTIVEQISEYGFDLKDLLILLPNGLELIDLEQALEKISNRIQRLGPINLAAIDEYSVGSERKKYLDKQNDELEEALATLESAIRKIDRETRVRFKETFDLINASFQELFPKLFGGGRSYLELTSDDLLEAGVAIMARPPGKKNTTVHLLSGGEKAMTAIALVFSIFYLNPAPFCMLDEVDAPLDDSNVYRYAKMVKEISSRVQIVYISHNKNAMEMANQLIGVTMHEAGVSRLVSVDINQVVESAGA